jgi:hypothetical protein
MTTETEVVCERHVMFVLNVECCMVCVVHCTLYAVCCTLYAVLVLCVLMYKAPSLLLSFFLSVSPSLRLSVLRLSFLRLSFFLRCARRCSAVSSSSTGSKRWTAMYVFLGTAVASTAGVGDVRVCVCVLGGGVGGR